MPPLLEGIIPELRRKLENLNNSIYFFGNIYTLKKQATDFKNLGPDF